MVVGTGGINNRSGRNGWMGEPRGRLGNGQVRGIGLRGTCKFWILRVSRPSKAAAQMISAFIKALIELIAELIRGEIKSDKKAIDGDAPPSGLRARFRDKLRKQLRNK